ncbi:uncharacterized protein [Nicotiana sylvestris]|uniref:uncharacterized protein n=1 Tax=Nicotiana sylvestris TaxID=4096 RepID=UPI00388CCA47
MYSPRLYQGGLIRLQRRATKVLSSSIDEDKDQGWMGRFVRVRTSDIILTEKMSFPEERNMKPQKPRDEEEEGEDAHCELMARKRGGVEASKAVETVMVEKTHLRTEEVLEDGSSKVTESSGAEDVSHRDEQPPVTLYWEAFTKSRAKLNRCEANLKRLTEERDALKRLYVQNEEEIKDLQAELATAHKKQTDLIEQILQVQQKVEKIEQLHEESEIKEAETLGWK